MNKFEILTQALDARNQEVLMYQINIDNYRLAIEHIDASGDAELTEFQDKLKQLLTSECIEQKKAKVIQAVIAKQLEDMK